jgi:hypothetical protein
MGGSRRTDAARNLRSLREHASTLTTRAYASQRAKAGLDQWKGFEVYTQS